MAADPRDPWKLSPEFAEFMDRLNAALVRDARNFAARWAAAVEAAKAAPPVDADLEPPSVPSTKEPTE